MQATLTELHRHTAKVVRPVIHQNQEVSLTLDGEEVARIVPSKRKRDRKAILKALKEIGPVKILPRK